VIYTGTFSKVLFPALRLGYLVAPEPLVDAFVNARALADRHAPGVEQAVVAEFLAEGHFARHVRRMRALYGERQAEMVAAGRRELAGVIDIGPADAGMHLVGRLPRWISDRAASRAAAELGVVAPPISAYSIRRAGAGGLMLGYAGVNTRQIRDGIRKLASAMLNLRGDSIG
jgi:GntR family transcriptional regulator/MocR family aminotransferase